MNFFRSKNLYKKSILNTDLLQNEKKYKKSIKDLQFALDNFQLFQEAYIKRGKSIAEIILVKQKIQNNIAKLKNKLL